MKQITLEEYQNAIQILNTINQYQKETSLNMLILQLIRENSQLDRQINLEIKILLKPYSLSKNIYTSLENYLHNLINQLFLNLPLKEKEPLLLIYIPEFNQFLTKITILINQKRNNFILQKAIINLQSKEEKSLIIKNIYEKQNRHKLFSRKKRTN